MSRLSVCGRVSLPSNLVTTVGRANTNRKICENMRGSEWIVEALVVVFYTTKMAS